MTNTKGNEAFAVKRATTGLGLFTLAEIPPRSRIIEYLGPLISNTELETRRGKYFFGVNSKWAIDGSARTNIARYINHSCKPNAEAFVTRHRVWIWSKSRIKAGEEITINYGQEYFDDQIKPIGCKCPSCAEQTDPPPAAAG